MCGILGVYTKNQLLKQAFYTSLDGLDHRGPHFKDVYETDTVCLGHTRLSIIDKSTLANQPFYSEDKRYVMVYNGEIYNFKSLRKELEQRGVIFNTQSDTEVVLKSYMVYGESMLVRFNGFFALAIFDQLTQSLFLARDRFGIKPLYYYHDNQDFAFSSEQRGITNMPINKEIDKSSIYQYFQYSYTPSQNSCFKHIKSVPAGHKMTLDLGKSLQTISSFPYYRVTKRNLGGSYTFDKAKSTTKKLISSAVKSRLYADVNVGCFLSGGVDSSIISLEATKYKSDLHTFSLGYEDAYFDESRYARLVADKIKSNHHELNLKSIDIEYGANQVLHHLDEPFADSSVIPFYLLSQFAKQYVDVVLSGDGADELFAGYNKHKALYKALGKGGESSIYNSSLLRWIELLPQFRENKIYNTIRKASRYLKSLTYNDIERYFYLSKMIEHPNSLFLNYTTQDNDSKMLRQYILPKVEDLDDYLIADINMLLSGDMLKKVDMMSMANSLEVRTPFLDHNLVDFVMGMPASYKRNNLGGKYLLKEAFKKELPKEVFSRAKRGFEVPLSQLLRSSILPQKKHLFSKAFIEHQKVFNYSTLNDIIVMFCSGKRGQEALIWSLIVFNNWWEKHVL